MQRQLTIDFDLTQVDRLLDYSQRGGTVTSMEAYDRFRITQLGRCIKDLERRGYHFNRPRKKLPSGTIICEYNLIED